MLTRGAPAARTLGGLALLGLCFTACAPATLSPMVTRLDRGMPTGNGAMLGLRSGPRLSSAVTTDPVMAPEFAGNSNSFKMPEQWSLLSYDLSLQRPLTESLSMHLGGQGEFYYPLPLPGYGLYAGLSYYLEAGPVSFAPSLTARGATDFGIPSLGGPGSILGAEGSLTFAIHADKKVALGLVPFVGVHKIWSGSAEETALFAGGVFAARVSSRAVVYELSAGFGRVFMGSRDTWNAPLFGIKAGR